MDTTETKKNGKSKGFAWLESAKRPAPVQQVLTPQPKAKAKEIDGFTVEEQCAILDAVKDAPHVEMWVLITPEMANDWLTNRNTKNRPISERRARAIAADIEHNRYGRTHQGVAFNVLGILADGQHRLAAICIAGVPVLMRVTFGLPEESIEHIDAGMNPRRAGDIFSMTGVVNGKSMAAMARAIYYLETGNNGPSFPVLRETLDRFADDLEWARAWIGRRHGRLTAHVCAAFAYAHSVHPAEIDALTRVVASGIGVTEKSAAAAIIAAIEWGRSQSAVSEVETMRKILRAAQVYVSGSTKPLVRLQDTPQGLEFFREARIKAGKG